MAAPTDDMVWRTDHPRFNFPRVVETPDRKIFSDCGSDGHVTGETFETLTHQRAVRADNLLGCSGPVLPIYFENDEYVETDVVMQSFIDVNEQMRCFLEEFSTLKVKSWKKTSKEPLEELLVSIKKFGLLHVNDQIPKWLIPTFQNYKQVRKYSGRMVNNFKFTNGCIVFVPKEKGSGCMVTPSGPDFKNIKLSYVKLNSDGIMQVLKVRRIELSQTVYGISHHHVCDTDFICVKTDKTCYIYQLFEEEESYELIFINDLSFSTEGSMLSFQCFNMSPYIPNECCVATESEDVFIWNGEKLENLINHTDAETKHKNIWCQAYFGSHPRCLISANQSAVKLYDLRCHKKDALGLLSMDNLCEDGRDQVRVCQNSPWSTFNHFVATDYSFMQLDERFPKIPVVTLDHMLQTMPQYISPISTDENDLVYIGSQFKPVVHRLVFKRTVDQPPQKVGLPRRISPWSDLSSIPNVTKGCESAHLLKPRLTAALTGIKAVQYDKHSHMVLQLDGHGEVFYQTFYNNKSSSDETDVQSHSTGTSHYSPAVIKQANDWMRKLSNLTATHRKNISKWKKDVSSFFEHMVAGPPRADDCALCSNKADLERELKDTNRCRGCHVLIAESRLIKEISEKDRIIPVKKVQIPDDLPKKGSQSKLWNSLSIKLLDLHKEHKATHTANATKKMETDNG